MNNMYTNNKVWSNINFEPQGSILDPILFSLYTVFGNVVSDTSFAMYADAFASI